MNRHVILTGPECPRFGSRELTRRPNGRLARLAYDLHFTPSGIRRWVTRYTTDWHLCHDCDQRFLPRDYLCLDAHFHSLKSWAIELCPEGYTDTRRYSPARFTLKGRPVAASVRSEAD